MKRAAPVHKGKFLSSRASTKRHAPHSSPTQPVTPVASVANAQCLTAKKGDASATIANNSVTPGAEPLKQLRSSSKTIASGPESRRSSPSLTAEPESNHSGSGLQKPRLLCHSQSRRNQPHQGHCVQQPQKQRRSRPEYARLAFFTLCTLLRRGAQQVPRQALRSSGANPAFDRSHSPIALSLRKRGALSYCGTIKSLFSRKAKIRSRRWDFQESESWPWGWAYCGFRRFRRSKLGFTQADWERMDQRFDQVERQMVAWRPHSRCSWSPPISVSSRC